jgi:hypothetical protein
MAMVMSRRGAAHKQEERAEADQSGDASAANRHAQIQHLRPSSKVRQLEGSFPPRDRRFSWVHNRGQAKSAAVT